MSRDRRQCLHHACRCILEEPGKYCSEECVEAGEDDPYCPCDHDQCHHSGLRSDYLPAPH